MSIKIRDSFYMNNSSSGVCAVYRRPLHEHETKVFRIGAVMYGDMLDQPLEISEDAAKDIAMAAGFVPPQRHEAMSKAYEAEISDLRASLRASGATTEVVRTLTRELDLADAMKQDAVRQFNAAETVISLMQENIDCLTAEGATLSAENNDYRSEIADMELTIDNMQGEIDALTALIEEGTE